MIELTDRQVQVSAKLQELARKERSKHKSLTVDPAVIPKDFNGFVWGMCWDQRNDLRYVSVDTSLDATDEQIEIAFYEGIRKLGR